MSDFTCRCILASVILVAALIIYIFGGEAKCVGIGITDALLVLIYLGGARDGKE